MDGKLAKEAFIEDMLGSIGSFDTRKIPKAYRSMTGNPLGAALFNAAAVGIPSYFLARPMARGLTALKSKVMQETPEQAQQALTNVDENVGQYKLSLAAMLAAMAGGLTLSETYMPKSIAPKTGGLNSWFQWEHPKPEGQMTNEEFEKQKNELTTRPVVAPDYFEKTEMLKEAMGSYGMADTNPLHGHPGVPVDYSLDLIWGDKYLNGREKINASLPIANAGEGTSGMVSIGDITRGALRAGFGAGAGFIAGKALGTILSAPTTVTQTLSATGALAGMLKNTGVF